MMAERKPGRVDVFRRYLPETEITEMVVVRGGDGERKAHALTFFLAHDLVRKPVPTFRDHARLASILSRIIAAMSGPPTLRTARMPVGEVTLISVMKSPITSMPTNSSPRSR